MDLFIASLGALTSEVERLERHLSPSERLRSERLIDPAKRIGFAAGRGFVRETLGRYLQIEPERIELDNGEFGKPYLAWETTSPSLRFNVSHAGDLLLLAVTLGREIGVDVEAVGPQLEFRGMAERYFSAAERAELSALPVAEQLPAFYRCWTRKEAYLKGLGSGFSRRSDGFDVGLSGKEARIIADRDAPEAAKRWSLIDIPVPDGYAAALAYQGEKPSVRLVGV
ncbi:4'-phosphopantetheinyl transferase family protein [Geomesophilobacter sediminis]|uniref:4'-phosphopantetheinyl transferase family protein n=1 Tax=Geomesophilobacter sediminis TaxID=2798584 RepID=UPI002E290DE2|nr:4'-phosphopantetheinyl transferase superfamily protein [Geomesophilobacter sediminis]